MSVPREKLYEEVWAEPMTKVAERYGVSSNYLAQVCSRLNVPRPSRGYWAQREVGKVDPQPTLPAPRPGDDIEWSRNGRAKRAPFPLPKAPTEKPSSLHPPDRPPTRHELTFGARELFEHGKMTDHGYFQPTTYTLVDAFVTQGTLGRSLDFLTKLFIAFESHGYRVTLAPSRQHLIRPDVDTRSERCRRDYYTSRGWNPCRATVAHLGTVAIGLTLFELTERVTVHWVDGKYVRVPERRRERPSNVYAHERDMPSGKLCLRAFSPYPRANWTREWREVEGVKLATKIDEIIRDVASAAPDIATMVIEAERKAEIERKESEIAHEKWKRERAEEQRLENIQKSRDELLSIIDAWAAVRRIEGFFEDAERRVAALEESKAAPLRERLAHARELIGEADALRRLQNWKTPEEQPRPWSTWGD